jgi:hypothetical protein
MEGYIKNHKNGLQSDRTSCHKFEANQFRLLLHSAAYVLLHSLVTTGLPATKWVNAQFDTHTETTLESRGKNHRTGHKDQNPVPRRFSAKAPLSGTLWSL